MNKDAIRVGIVGAGANTRLRHIPGLQEMEAEFIGAIRGEEEIRLTSFEDGVRYMEFTEAVHDSWSTQRAVALPDPAL